MDPLVEVPVENWLKLLEKLKEVWPMNAPGYYALDLHLKKPAVRAAFKFTVYCPFGDIEAGFIATTQLKNVLECIIWPFSGDTQKIEEALIKTTLVDWTQVTCIDTVTSQVLKMLERIKSDIGFCYFHVGRVDTYFLDQRVATFNDVSCPPGTYLAPLKKDLIPHVNEKWPYKHENSTHYFSTLAENGLSYALYSSVNSRLLAWLFVNEYSFLCHLYCEGDGRRRGYAEFLMKHVASEQLKSGDGVYSYVEKGNERSSALFRKLGFRIIDEGAYLFVQK